MKSQEQIMLEQIIARMDIILAKLGTMNAPPVRKSKLEPYTQEILAMRDKGISEQKIVEFLETERGVKITQQTLNYFLKRQKNKSKR